MSGTETTEIAPRRQRGVGSLETGGAILRHLARAQAPMMLRDLADALGIRAAQLHPYMVSLREIGLVEQTERGLYALGPFALELGLSRLRSQNAYRETLRRVPALAEALDLMVAVSVWGLHGATIVYVHESPNQLHANVQPGGIFRMTNTATGALFGANLSPALTGPVLAAEFAASVGPGTASPSVDSTALRARLDRIAAQGYATTRDIPIPGVSAVAVPIFDHTGTMRLAVTVIGPTGVIGLEPESPAVVQSLAFASRLSADLGWIGAGRDSMPPTAAGAFP
jgi:DNA-binding IclR family transcriptional regulator